MDGVTLQTVITAAGFMLNVGVVVFAFGRLSERVKSISETLEKGGALDDRVARRILTHQLKCPAAARSQGTNPRIPVDSESMGG